MRNKTTAAKAESFSRPNRKNPSEYSRLAGGYGACGVQGPGLQVLLEICFSIFKMFGYVDSNGMSP